MPDQAQHSPPNRIAGLLRRFARSCRGAAALEFALILPIVVFSFVSMVDVAAAVRIQMRLDSIIRSGVQVAMENGDLDRIRTVLAEAARLDSAAEDDPDGPAVTARRLCICEGEVACDTVCPGGGPPSVLFQLGAEQTAEGLFLPPFRLTSTARVEVR